MLIPVAPMPAVQVAIVDVVHVVVVRDGHMPTSLTVLMRVVLMNGVLSCGALVPVVVMPVVQMSVMDVVHVSLMGDGHMPTSLTVLMRVTFVHKMRGRHLSSTASGGNISCEEGYPSHEGRLKEHHEEWRVFSWN